MRNLLILLLLVSCGGLETGSFKGSDGGAPGAAADGPFGSVDAAPSGPMFRITTQNILHGLNDEDPLPNYDGIALRLNVIGPELARLRPAVAMIQEVNQSPKFAPGYPDVMGTLLGILNADASLPPYTGIFGDIRGGALETNSGQELGQTTFTNLPIVQMENHALPLTKLLPPEFRSLMHVRVAGPAGNIDVYNAHLQGPDNASDSAKEMNDVLAFIDATRDPDGFTILGGDLNSTEEKPVWNLLRNAGYTDLGHASGLLCNPPAERHGCTNETFPLSKPGNRTTIKLDYFWAKSAHPFHAVCQPALGHPFPQNNGGVLWASDHIGVQADITFEDASQ